MNILGETPATWADATLNFIFPGVCQTCGEHRATPAESFLCAECRRQVRYIRRPFCARCGLPFDGAITTVIDRLQLKAESRQQHTGFKGLTPFYVV